LNYQLPPINILSKSPQTDLAEQYEQATREGDLLEDKTEQLGSRLNIEEIHIGPQVISYDCIPAEKVLARSLRALAADLQLELGCETISIQAPNPGSKFVSVEIPNKNRRTILLGDVINSANSPLEFPLGVDTENNTLAFDIRKAPHILCGGTTGAGKSTMLHSIICSLLMKTTPDDLLFWMCDTKMVELTAYDNIPNLLCPVITDPYDAVESFKALVLMMEDRYSLAQEYRAKNLDELNSRLIKKLPYILVIVDDIADLMFLSKHDVEESITRIAGKARAVGIHLLLATQSPRREVVSGLLKSNLPSRIGFSTQSGLDSRIIMDCMGCQNLIGNGDMLFSNQGRAPVRIQAPFISTDEIESICNHCKNQVIREVAA
jgi:S-DNA-T family DNA segregation ATPase FtsK/SpoIIIE